MLWLFLHPSRHSFIHLSNHLYGYTLSRAAEKTKINSGVLLATPLAIDFFINYFRKFKVSFIIERNILIRKISCKKKYILFLNILIFKKLIFLLKYNKNIEKNASHKYISEWIHRVNSHTLPLSSPKLSLS